MFFLLKLSFNLKKIILRNILVSVIVIETCCSDYGIKVITICRVFFCNFLSAKSRCKAATNLWADTDEEDNADSIDEDAQVETNEDQVNISFA